MKIAAVTFSVEGVRILSRLAQGPGEVDLYVHRGVSAPAGAVPFDRVFDLAREIFSRYQGLVFVAPCGVVVRAIAPLVEHKLSDPAVVCVDAGGRYAVSLLSGHEGGANGLAMVVGNAIGAEPVISTTTEAVKDLVVGIGCRRGKPAEEIVEAPRSALGQLGCGVERVRLLATADVKAREQGLLEASAALEIPLRVIDSEEIRRSTLAFGRSDFVEENVNLPAVAEPAALLAGRRTQLILQKTAFNGITIAIARENCFSLESAPVAPSTAPPAPPRRSSEATSS